VGAVEHGDPGIDLSHIGHVVAEGRRHYEDGERVTTSHCGWGCRPRRLALQGRPTSRRSVP
jgi:hypothetical protein